MAAAARQKWGSQLGFVLAAAGSAIGLGNIVFFSARANDFGAGAFYLPYFIAFFVVGVPLMILEFALGAHTRKAFPGAMAAVGGRFGEFVGWLGVLNTTFINFYYVTLLGWVAGMWWYSFGATVLTEAGEIGLWTHGPKPMFKHLTESWGALVFVLGMWIANLLAVMRGTASIERVNKVMIPLLWVLIAVLIVRGLTLPGGVDGLLLLFTPDWSLLVRPEVWIGAFTQIFFTLSLGFGIMTAYASYLPARTDHVSNATMVCAMNCAFEYVCGMAVFSLLFAFAVQPQASSLAMMFFVVPEGIAKFPVGVQLFGVLFFSMLLMAGLTSSISLIEALVAAVGDKFGGPRGPAVWFVWGISVAASVLFALPYIVQSAGDTPAGLFLLDVVDHYTNQIGLFVVCLLETLIVAWVADPRAITATVNRYSRVQLGEGYVFLIRWVSPAVMALLLGLTLFDKIAKGPYNSSWAAFAAPTGADLIAWAGFAFWLLGTFGAAAVLARLPSKTA